MLTITGIYDKTFFRSEDNGYTVFTIRTKDLNEYKTETGQLFCMGTTPLYIEGMPLKIIGEIVPRENNYYILKVINSELYADDFRLWINYLSSSAFSGIGVKTAEKIINFIGTDVLSFIEKSDAAQLLRDNIPELKGAKADAFIKNIRNTNIEKQIYDEIVKYGGKYSNAEKMYEKFGIESLQLFKNNPYYVGYESGLSFMICDIYAISHGCQAFDTNRLKSLTYRLIELNESRGNTYITISELYDFLNYYCKKMAVNDFIPVSALLPVLSNTPGILVIHDADTIKIFKKATWENENKITTNLSRLKTYAYSTNFDKTFILHAQEKLSISYSEEQKKVFDLLRSTGIKILTGGPGTGKSTVINGLITIYKEMYPLNTIALCAPTGRAAQRMTEITGLPASTLHRLLDIHPFSDTIAHRDSTCPIDQDLIIVDEMSMADTEITAILLGAIKNGSLVVLCGDVDQLPSVGCGNVLHDLIDSNIIETYQLTQIFRQKGDSDIITNANNIKNGVPKIQEGKGVSLIRVKNENEFESIVKDIIAKYYDANDIFKLQLLSTTKKGPGGTKNLNSIVQKQIFAKEQLTIDSKAIDIDSCRYFVGDKIIMTKNNYEAGYLNGDIGIITEINSNSVVVDINNESITIKNHDLKDMKLCYAITTHKSQGAEFDTVVIILPQTPSNMLQRNLFYTALTRAKDKVIIISEQNSSEYAIYNDVACVRKTDLKNKILKSTK